MILRLIVSIGAVLLFAVLFFLYLVAESRRKRELGSNYEGPLDGFDD
jgi:hypothetical protein